MGGALKEADMTSAPLSRDRQIELMKGAVERHQSFARRWSADAQIRQVIREGAPAEEGHHYVRRDETIRKCG